MNKDFVATVTISMEEYQELRNVSHSMTRDFEDISNLILRVSRMHREISNNEFNEIIYQSNMILARGVWTKKESSP